MRRNLAVVILALLGTVTLCFAQTGTSSKSTSMKAVGDGGEQKIIDASRATWEAYKSRDIAGMKAHTAESYVAYTLEGPSTLQEDIASINSKKLVIESYTMDDAKVTMLTKDVAILRYKCDVKGSFGGKPLKPVYATEVWLNRGGKWQIVSYSETPVS